ncbi:unnamed protein product [Calypogeia fissa]
MREFRGDGGRESASSNINNNNNNKAAADAAASEFQKMDWKGSSDRELNNVNNSSNINIISNNTTSIITNIRTDRKDARGDHRGGGGGGTDVREVTTMAGRRGESRSGGDNGSSGTRERKSSDDLLRVSSSSAAAAQETGQEVRESWGSRTFLKSSSSSQAPVAAATSAPPSKHGGEEEGEIGDFTEDGGAGAGVSAAAGGGGGEPPMRFEETKRKRDERGGHMNSNNSNSINANNVTDREERQRDKSERRGVGGDLQVHISFVPPSQQQHLHREKDREEKQGGAERDKAEKESTTTTTTTNSSNSKQKEKDKVNKDEESSAVGSKEKGGSGGNKESEVDSRRGDKEIIADGYNSNRRKEAAPASAADQDEKDQNNPSGTDRVEKRGVPLSMVAEFDQHESAAGTSGGGGKGALQLQQLEENSTKVGGEAESKERATVDSKEQQQQHEKHEKMKNEPIVEEEKEKGKRKLRDYDRAAGCGDDANNTNNNNADGAEDFEREVVSSYGIQRKRLLRPRGHYQGSNTREVRPRFRVKDLEAPVRTAAENFTLMYRAGEGLQEELRKIRKEFKDRYGKLTAEQQSSQAVVAAAAGSPTIEVRIPAELATTSNRQVQGSQLWGTDVYTDDSDLVAILMHTGYYAPTSSSPANTILELRATVKVRAPQDRYTSTLRNSLRSRSWGAASGCSLSVESCYLVKKDGGKVQLEPRLTFTPPFAPTLAPAVTERTVTTRAVSMNAYRAQRFVQEVTIQYNLCNEPWLKYSMNIVADKGLKKSQYTSARLKKNDVLYVETHFHRYELSFEDPKIVAAPAETKALLEKGKDKAEITEKGLEKIVDKGQQGVSSKEIVVAGNNHNNGPVAGDKYRWALCRWPLSLQSMRAKGVPLSLEYVKVLESGLGWEEVQWSPAGVCVRGKEYPLARAHFVPMHE